MPTGIPDSIGDLFDNTELMILAIGIATLGVIYLASGLKWGRSQA